MKNILIIILIPVLSLYACKKQNRLPDPKPINLTTNEKAEVQSGNAFGIDLLKKLSDSTGEHNMMISPLSVSQALLMTYNGANGDTKTAFEQTLHLAGMSMEEVNKANKSLREALLSVDPKVTLNIANSVWYRNTFTVKQDFIERNQTYYNATVKALDFDNQGSVNEINNWVDENTNRKINKIVEQLNPLDRMLLINAIYFKGEWRNQFDKSLTAAQPFYPENGTSFNVSMMHTTGTYSYYENDLMEALEMPYGRANFSMVVLLPKQDYTISDIMDTLSADVWYQWETGMIEIDEVPVSFPKFEFEYEKSLNDVLKSMGLSVAFTDQADFSGINDTEDLFISNVKHKTYIKTDEEGTEAAAVTSVTVGTSSIGPGEPFIVDHPFVFIIKEKYTHAILFEGYVVNPNDGGVGK